MPIDIKDNSKFKEAPWEENFNEALPKLLHQKMLKHLYFNKQNFYEDIYRQKWVVKRDFTLGSYIAAGLYTLILGKVVAEEQLVISEKGLHIGSKFIYGFQSLSSFLRGRHPAKIFDQKFLGESSNVWLLFATMVLLGETDAHLDNLGVIKNNDGSFSLAKIDHDHSMGIQFDKLLKAANSLNAGTFGGYNFSKVFNDHSRDFIRALSEVEKIPDDLWGEVVKSRINEFRFANKQLKADYSQIEDNFNSIKKEIPKYIEGLTLEQLIREGDLAELKNLISNGLDPNGKYYYINLPYNSQKGDDYQITPIEMAAKANKPKVLEYFLGITPPDVELQKKMLKNAMEADQPRSDAIACIMNWDGFSLDDATLLKCALLGSDPTILKEGFLNLGKSIDFSLLVEKDASKEYQSYLAMTEIKQSNNVLAYQKFAEEKGFGFNDHMQVLSSITEGPIEYYIINYSLVNNSEQAEEKFRIIQARQKINDKNIKKGMDDIFGQLPKGFINNYIEVTNIHDLYSGVTNFIADKDFVCEQWKKLAWSAFEWPTKPADLINFGCITRKEFTEMVISKYFFKGRPSWEAINALVQKAKQPLDISVIPDTVAYNVKPVLDSVMEVKSESILKIGFDEEQTEEPPEPLKASYVIQCNKLNTEKPSNDKFGISFSDSEVAVSTGCSVTTFFIDPETGGLNTVECTGKSNVWNLYGTLC